MTFDISNQIRIRGQILSEHAFGTLEHFCQTSDCTKIDRLLGINLDEMGGAGGGDDEIKDSNSQTQHPLKDRTSSMSGRKAGPIPSSHTAEISENQISEFHPVPGRILKSELSDLTGWPLLKGDYRLRSIGVLKIGRGNAGRSS